MNQEDQAKGWEKAMGPDEIPIEVWKCLGDVGVCWLTNIFNKILSAINKMPSKWRRSTLIPIYKNKGDDQNCTNYHEIKLIRHIMELQEIVIENRLRYETTPLSPKKGGWGGLNIRFTVNSYILKFFIKGCLMPCCYCM